jgi:hypothetical protein
MLTCDLLFVLKKKKMEKVIKRFLVLEENC